jgi:hypothetical protein
MRNWYSKIRGVKESTMRFRTAGKVVAFTAVLGFACLLPARVHAQVDAQPDTNLYEGPNMERIGGPSVPVASANGAKAEFAGTFSLPYQVACGAKKLNPGEYSLSVKSDGTGRVVTIHGKAASMKMPARVVPANRATSHSELLVSKSGERHRIEGVYIAELNATLYLGGHAADGVMERLPIS